LIIWLGIIYERRVGEHVQNTNLFSWVTFCGNRILLTQILRGWFWSLGPILLGLLLMHMPCIMIDRDGHFRILWISSCTALRLRRILRVSVLRLGSMGRRNNRWYFFRWRWQCQGHLWFLHRLWRFFFWRNQTRYLLGEGLFVIVFCSVF
jgi:hypothetical protein